MLVLLMIDWAVCRPCGEIDFHGIARTASSRAARLDVASEPEDEEDAGTLSPLICPFELGVDACALVVNSAINIQARQQRLLTAIRAREGAAPLFIHSSPVIDVPPFRHVHASRCQQGAQRVKLCRSHKLFRSAKHYGERKDSVRPAIAWSSDFDGRNMGGLGRRLNSLGG